MKVTKSGHFSRTRPGMEAQILAYTIHLNDVTNFLMLIFKDLSSILKLQVPPVKQYSILPPAIPLTSSVVYKVSQTLLMFCCYRNRSTTREDNFHLIFKIFQTLWWTRPWMTLLWHWMLNWTNHSTEDSVHNYSFCPSCESSSHTPNVLTECKSRILNHFNLSQICWFEP